MIQGWRAELVFILCQRNAVFLLHFKISHFPLDYSTKALTLSIFLRRKLGWGDEGGIESGKFHPTVNRGVKEETTKGVCVEQSMWCVLTFRICPSFRVLYFVLTIHQALFQLQGAQKGQRQGQPGGGEKQDIPVGEFTVATPVQLSFREFISVISTSLKSNNGNKCVSFLLLRKMGKRIWVIWLRL